MAYIAKTAFEARITNGRFEDLANIAGRYQEDSADAICSAGMLCVRNGQTDCEGFSGVKNENTWFMNPAEEVTSATVIYACNTHDVNLITDPIFGGQYAVGTNTLGLPAPAGRECTFTRIDFDGQSVYRFGEGNISGTYDNEEYFIVQDGLLVPSSEQVESGFYFSLRGTGKFVEGTTDSFGYIDVCAEKPL